MMSHGGWLNLHWERSGSLRAVGNRSFVHVLITETQSESSPPEEFSGRTEVLRDSSL